MLGREFTVGVGEDTFHLGRKGTYAWESGARNQNRGSCQRIAVRVRNTSGNPPVVGSLDSSTEKEESG